MPAFCTQFRICCNLVVKEVPRIFRQSRDPYKGRLPVRGLRRITDMMIGAAAVSNIRSILRYHKRKRKRLAEREVEKWQETYKIYQENSKQVLNSAFLFSLPLFRLTKKPVFVTCFFVTCFSC